MRHARFPFIILISACCLFLGLGAYQLHLPGLHYDEAKEAGLNAMQLVTGQPVTAFRDATVQIGPWRLPLMVQDYIGALNVLLATPFLAVGGVNVVALRWLPLLTAALTLWVTWRVAWRLGGPAAASAAALLLAVNPAFIFWSRQGIFVTNLTALIFMTSMLTGLRWWRDRRPRDLWLTALLWGLGIYTKLLFVWASAALLIVAALAGALKTRSWKPGLPHSTQQPAASFRSQALTLTLALISFLIPLLPLIAFNLRTGGTLTALFGNLGRSYYGVDNRAYLSNLATRLTQLGSLLRGDHLGYLGETWANAWAPWMAALLLGLALLVSLTQRRSPSSAEGPRPRGPDQRLHAAMPLLLLALIVAQSAFTVSALFITHYALLLPLLPLVGGLAFGVVWRQGGLRLSKPGDLPPRRRGAPAPHGRILFAALALAALLTWAGGDLWTTVRYHSSLAATGGRGQHAATIYELAATLDRAGLTTPVALDWGLDAPIQFLTAGRVQPSEVFGYTGLELPDPGYAERMNPYLGVPDTIYLAHVPEQTVFRNRVNALADLASRRGLTLREQAYFNTWDGRPFIIVYRAGK